ncbi:RNA polymerase sigma factor [Desulfosediminicola flagellatus]|uniref:RNA polymerase sigma factor n=1 Tax=Desulfosediminicola flagellatus TaxID=2569541 RepID=UPI0010AC56F9|nr:RNA polymerase sigma factor [Desulfosediminicola flagellatus]
MKKFTEFYSTHKDRLFGYLLRKTGNYQLSADIMQESFVKYLEMYKTRERSTALLFTISRNLLIDQFRRQRPETEFKDEKHSSSNGQEQQYLIREEARRVLDAIQQLDKEDADILSLVVTSNLSYAEISKVTKLSEANVKVRVHRSRLKLRDILKEVER